MDWNPNFKSESQYCSIKESKVTCGGIFSLKRLTFIFAVYAHKTGRFQNCVMLFKMAARFPIIWALGDILVPVSWQTKSKKTPFLARPEPISNTLYNTLE